MLRYYLYLQENPNPKNVDAILYIHNLINIAYFSILTGNKNAACWLQLLFAVCCYCCIFCGERVLTKNIQKTFFSLKYLRSYSSIKLVRINCSSHILSMPFTVQQANVQYNKWKHSSLYTASLIKYPKMHLK